MQAKAILTLLTPAAMAFPSASLRERFPAVTLDVLAGSGCNSGPVMRSDNITTDGVCHEVAALPGNAADSFRVRFLPAGCMLRTFTNPTCDSVNFINITVSDVGDCRTFGDVSQIRGAKTFGTC